nr:MAG TPA_asm: Minor capsid protein [Caudoviricetes sp.]
MSKIARFSYKALATIYPVTRDDWNNSKVYGQPYLIDCTWTSTEGKDENERGSETDVSYVIFTELLYNLQPVERPQKGWMIALGDTTAFSDPLEAGANEISGVVEWDMSMFNDTPDYKIITGNSVHSKY